MHSFGALLLVPLLLGLCLGKPAAAQTSGPIDCTAGCTIVTCEGTTCWVWQCDSSGCRITGSYRRSSPVPQELAPVVTDKPKAFDQVCEVHGKQACTFKTCQAGACSISMFDGKSFIPIGRVEDVDTLIERARTGTRRN